MMLEMMLTKLIFPNQQIIFEKALQLVVSNLFKASPSAWPSVEQWVTGLTPLQKSHSWKKVEVAYAAGYVSKLSQSGFQHDILHQSDGQRIIQTAALLFMCDCARRKIGMLTAWKSAQVFHPEKNSILVEVDKAVPLLFENLKTVLRICHENDIPENAVTEAALATVARVIMNKANGRTAMKKEGREVGTVVGAPCHRVALVAGENGAGSQEEFTVEESGLAHLLLKCRQRTAVLLQFGLAPATAPPAAVKARADALLNDARSFFFSFQNTGKHASDRDVAAKQVLTVEEQHNLSRCGAVFTIDGSVVTFSCSQQGKMIIEKPPELIAAKLVELKQRIQSIDDEN